MKNSAYLVIGAGGTGSWLVPMLAKHVKNTTELDLCDYDKLCVFDPDMVEYKNITRQNFYACDVYKNKAEVLYNRYINETNKCPNGRYGIAVDGTWLKSIMKYYSFDRIHSCEVSNIHIIICTDTAVSKKVLADALQGLVDKIYEGRKFFVTFSGNSKAHGQVETWVLKKGDNVAERAATQPHSMLHTYVSETLSEALKRDMLDDTPPCAGFTVVGEAEQTGFANQMAAMLVQSHVLYADDIESKDGGYRKSVFNGMNVTHKTAGGLL